MAELTRKTGQKEDHQEYHQHRNSFRCESSLDAETRVRNSGALNALEAPFEIEGFIRTPGKTCVRPPRR